MKKIIIEIDEQSYEDAINDTEWDTLSLGIYLKEQVKNGKPLQAEFEEIKAEIKASRILTTDRIIVDEILDNRIAELKGENNG